MSLCVVCKKSANLQCSGCNPNTRLFCSNICQNQDWRNGHRNKCLSIHKQIRGQCRDATSAVGMPIMPPEHKQELNEYIPDDEISTQLNAFIDYVPENIVGEPFVWMNYEQIATWLKYSLFSEWFWKEGGATRWFDAKKYSKKIKGAILPPPKTAFLFDAIREHDTHQVDLILKHGEIDPEGKQFLYAVEKGYADIVKLLLANKHFDLADVVEEALSIASRKRKEGIIKLLLADPRVDLSAIHHLVRLSNGNLRIFKLFLNWKPVPDDGRRVDPAAKNNLAIIEAIQNKYTEFVKLLLADPRVNPADNDNAPIQLACESGAVDIVTLLLADPRVDPTANNNASIRAAARAFSAVVELLLAWKPVPDDGKRVDPTANNNESIREAARRRMDDIIKTLLAWIPNPDNGKRVDPSANNNEAIRSCRGDYFDVRIVKLLFADERVRRQFTPDDLARYQQVVEGPPSF